MGEFAMNTRQTLTLKLFLAILLAGFVPGFGNESGAAPDVVTANAGWAEIGTGSASGGGISSTTGGSSSPSLIVVPDGSPVIAWEDNSNSKSAIYVRRWNGTSWVQMGAGSDSGGGISNSTGNSTTPALAVSATGALFAAWRDTGIGNGEIYLRRWNGTSWVELGTGSASGGGVSNTTGVSENPALAIPDNGWPIVAWKDDTSGSDEIYVKRWNGSAWVELGNDSATGGGISNSTGNTFRPALIIPPDGFPIVAWSDTSNGNAEIYVRRYNGLDWEEMSSGSASGEGISNNSGGSFRPSMAVGPDGNPIIAWEDSSGGSDFEIYVRRWNGTDWVTMSSGSASGGGISNNGGDSKWPSVAIRSDGSPLIAWEDSSQDDEEIYLRRWNGTAWVEMEANSATGGGISDDDGGSYSLTPSLAASADGASVVAWQNVSEGGGSEIFARRHIKQPCYLLETGHTGQGTNPVPAPANSADCPANRYNAGQEISLSAAPASGWRVTGWSGTENDAGTATTNSLTMPGSDHTVGVTYAVIPTTSHRIFLAQIMRPQPDTPPPCFAGPDEVEPNNNPASANGPLCQGVTYRGLPNDMLDMFKLEASEAKPISVVVTDHRGGGVQLALYYQRYETGARVAIDVDQSDGLRVDYPQAQPGLYYIVIYTETPKPAETGKYTMQVVFQ